MNQNKLETMCFPKRTNYEVCTVNNLILSITLLRLRLLLLASVVTFSLTFPAPTSTSSLGGRRRRRLNLVHDEAEAAVGLEPERPNLKSVFCLQVVLTGDLYPVSGQRVPPAALLLAVDVIVAFLFSIPANEGHIALFQGRVHHRDLDSIAARPLSGEAFPLDQLLLIGVQEALVLDLVLRYRQPVVVLSHVGVG
ncbi:hypothetical protein V2J09_024003 [Rumex salicifolius]